MKVFKIVLLGLCIVGAGSEIIFAKSSTLTQKQLKHYKPLKANEGKKIISLTKSKLSDVHLAKPVKYFDIKLYNHKGKYATGWSFDMAAYKKLSSKEKNKIRSVQVVKKKSSFWHIYMNDGTFYGYFNLHYLDSRSHVHTITSRKGLLAFLGTIDTATELSILLLNTSSKIRYKKMGDIYNLRIDEVSYPDCDGCGEPACTLFVHQRIINNKGKILLNTLVKEKSFKSEKECRGL